jgi:hypothetical protein
MRFPDGVWILVAVTVVPTGASGEIRGAKRFARGSLGRGSADVSARALDASEGAANGDVSDPETAEAISIIKQIRQRTNATE